MRYERYANSVTGEAIRGSFSSKLMAKIDYMKIVNIETLTTDTHTFEI